MKVRTIVNIIVLQIIIVSCANGNDEVNDHNPKIKESAKVKVFAERNKTHVEKKSINNSYKDISLVRQELVINQKHLEGSNNEMDSLQKIIEKNKRRILATNAKIEAYSARETQIKLIIDSLEKLK
jgi:ribosome-binding ATPase YchF (GTP1/OBG family)